VHIESGVQGALVGHCGKISGELCGNIQCHKIERNNCFDFQPSGLLFHGVCDTSRGSHMFPACSIPSYYKHYNLSPLPFYKS